MAVWTQIYTGKRFKLGSRKKQDGNEYIFTAGVSSLAAGDFVQVGLSTFACVRLTTTGPTSGIVGVAQSANTSATNYGWVQIAGRYTTANVATASSIAGKVLFASSTSGRCTTTPATEATIVGAFADGDSTANVGAVQLSYPVYPGDIST